MRIDVSQLNDRLKKMMRPEDRALFGKEGMTTEEAMLKAQIKSERELQNMLMNLLGLKGIVAFRQRMDKKATDKKGRPDILFAIGVDISHPLGAKATYACAWECKMPFAKPEDKLSEEQAKLAAQMIAAPNDWRWRLITSVDEALAELRSMGIQ